MSRKNNEDTLKVCFAGGGTGGHIYPGLAVADSLKELCKKNGKNVKIFWIGNSSGMDKTIVSKNVGPDGKLSADVFYGIPSGKLRRYFSIRNFFDLFKIAGGLFASFFILLKIKPDVLFSKGGFVSVPPCLAAKILKIPVFTHECDFTPGLATKLNSKSAEKILVSYEETKNYLSSAAKNKCVVTGNPVRPVFYSTFENKEQSEKRALEFLGLEKKDRPLLFVQGGSLGASQINELVKENIEWLCDNFIVVHQTGKNGESAVLPAGESDGASAGESSVKRVYKPFQFIYSEMPDVMALSDVILSRAGANSIWECAVLSKPMVLVPLCGSGTRGDQEDNAHYFEEKGAAFVLGRENATSENLKKSLESLLSLEQREKMALACKKMCMDKKPAEIISEIIYNRATSQ